MPGSCHTCGPFSLSRNSLDRAVGEQGRHATSNFRYSHYRCKEYAHEKGHTSKQDGALRMSVYGRPLSWTRSLTCASSHGAKNFFALHTFFRHRPEFSVVTKRTCRPWLDDFYRFFLTVDLKVSRFHTWDDEFLSSKSRLRNWYLGLLQDRFVRSNARKFGVVQPSVVEVASVEIEL